MRCGNLQSPNAVLDRVEYFGSLLRASLVFEPLSEPRFELGITQSAIWHEAVDEGEEGEEVEVAADLLKATRTGLKMSRPVSLHTVLAVC